MQNNVQSPGRYRDRTVEYAGVVGENLRNCLNDLDISPILLLLISFGLLL